MIEFFNECARQVFALSAIVFTLNYQITEKGSNAVGKTALAFFMVSAAISVGTYILEVANG